MATDISAEDRDFLAQCEEELKDRFTELDEDYMKVFNAEQPKPPIMENWRATQNRRFNNRRFHPYDSSNRNRNHDRYQDRGHNEYTRGYQDRSYEDQSYDNRRYGQRRGYTNSDNRNRDYYQPKRGRF